jgi:hypothetical protein
MKKPTDHKTNAMLRTSEIISNMIQTAKHEGDIVKAEQATALASQRREISFIQRCLLREACEEFRASRAR